MEGEGVREEVVDQCPIQERKQDSISHFMLQKSAQSCSAKGGHLTLRLFSNYLFSRL